MHNYLLNIIIIVYKLKVNIWKCNNNFFRNFRHGVKRQNTLKTHPPLCCLMGRKSVIAEVTKMCLKETLAMGIFTSGTPETRSRKQEVTVTTKRRLRILSFQNAHTRSLPRGRISMSPLLHNTHSTEYFPQMHWYCSSERNGWYLCSRWTDTLDRMKFSSTFHLFKTGILKFVTVYPKSRSSYTLYET